MRLLLRFVLALAILMAMAVWIVTALDPQTPGDPSGCVAGVELHSLEFWTRELGRPAEDYRINLWSESDEAGKGVRTGSLGPGAFAIVMERTASSYRVRGPGGSGWIGSVQVARDIDVNSATYRPCEGPLSRARVVEIRCPDGRLYIGNRPNEACK